MINKTRIKVRGYHLDVFQHVNNARYLEFMEEGRWAFFDEFDMGGKIFLGSSLGGDEYY